MFEIELVSKQDQCNHVKRPVFRQSIVVIYGWYGVVKKTIFWAKKCQIAPMAMVGTPAKNLPQRAMADARTTSLFHRKLCKDMIHQPTGWLLCELWRESSRSTGRKSRNPTKPSHRLVNLLLRLKEKSRRNANWMLDLRVVRWSTMHLKRATNAKR